MFRRVLELSATTPLVVTLMLAAAPVIGQDLQIQPRIFESRATAQQVNAVLLPHLIAQKEHPEDGFELPSTDVWWAWRSQYDLAIEQPITNAMHLASHNSYNAMGDGFEIFPALAPNQILGLTEQLDLGARLAEIDIHDSDSGFLEVFHAWDVAGERDFTDVLGDIAAWLARNPAQMVFVDIEDATEEPEGATVDTSVDRALRSFFGDPSSDSSLLFLPEDRAELGRWPSRRELLEMGKRVIVLTHRNDAGDGRFGEPTRYVDANGHEWYGAGLAFRADGGEDPVARRGNFRQFRVQDIEGEIADDPSLLANTNFFLSMQSDGIDQIPPSLLDPLLAFLPQIVDFFTQFDAERAGPGRVRRLARKNVNFLKMDFLFGHDEDAGLGSNAAFFLGVPYVRDDAYEIENDGSRVKRLRFAIWSWLEGDPAVQRQIFQDVVPGDGSGQQQRTWLAELFDSAPSFFDELETMGEAARTNERDYVIQRSTGSSPDRRWVSRTVVGSESMGGAEESFPFALRSIERDAATGRYRWKLSSTRGAADDVDLITSAELVDSDGFKYVFAGPVNGLQNEDLYEARLVSGEDDPVWLNVNDVDRDGFWTACPCATLLERLVVMEPVIDENGLGRLSFLFEDRDAFDTHTVTIDWGDGTAPQVIELTSGERGLDQVEHRYLDDDPSGTPIDTYTITLEIDDGITPPATGEGPIQVRNVPPVIDALSSSATALSPIPSGGDVSVLAQFSDVGLRDTHVAEISWGDGTVSSATVDETDGSGVATAVHAFASGGVFDIVATVVDDDTGLTWSPTTAFVTGVGLHEGVLQVVGTPERDVITVQPIDGRAIRVHADFLEARFQDFDLSEVERVEIWVCGAEDQINVAGSLRDVEVVVTDCAEL